MKDWSEKVRKEVSYAHKVEGVILCVCAVCGIGAVIGVI